MRRTSRELSTPPNSQALTRCAGVETKNLVHSYRELGHFIANLDPLGHNRPSHALLDLSQFDLTAADMDKRVTHCDFEGPFDGTLRDLIESLHTTYCSTLGVEFASISDKAQREWLIQRMEPILNRPVLTSPQRQCFCTSWSWPRGLRISWP